MYRECSEPAAWGCSWYVSPLEVDAGCVFTAKDGKIPIFQSPARVAIHTSKQSLCLRRWPAQRKRAVSIAFVLCVRLVKSLAGVLIVTTYQKREPLGPSGPPRPMSSSRSVTLGAHPHEDVSRGDLPELCLKAHYRSALSIKTRHMPGRFSNHRTN